MGTAVLGFTVVGAVVSFDFFLSDFLLLFLSELFEEELLFELSAGSYDELLLLPELFVI